MDFKRTVFKFLLICFLAIFLNLLLNGQTRFQKSLKSEVILSDWGLIKNEFYDEHLSNQMKKRGEKFISTDLKCKHFRMSKIYNSDFKYKIFSNCSGRQRRSEQPAEKKLSSVT